MIIDLTLHEIIVLSVMAIVSVGFIYAWWSLLNPPSITTTHNSGGTK